MGLNALATATAGLKATQAAIGLVSQNVANAGTAGYVRRTLTSLATGPGNAGVATGQIARSFDAAALRQLRLETSGAAYTSTKADVTSQLDALYGTPGSATALDGTLNTFTESLQELAANPNSAAARTTALQGATNLASRIGDIAQGVQALRTGIENRLATETKDASGLLAGIASLNVKIQTTPEGSARADLLDQRDAQVNRLSGYFDIQTVEERDGTLTVLTGSGVTLVDRGSAAGLSFDGRSNLSAASAYTMDPDTRGVGTVTATTPGGAQIDLGEPGVLRSGTMGAELELRDRVLPQAQRQLDDLAAGLAGALTDAQVTGTVSGSGATTDLTGIKPGNSLTVQVSVGNGAVRNVVLVASNGATAPVDPSQTADAGAYAQTFDVSGGPATYGDAVKTALEALTARLQAEGVRPVPGLTAGGSGASVTVSSTDGSTKVVGAGATITQPTSGTDLSTGYPSLALFVDGSGNALVTGSLDAGSQRTGLAQRLVVNPAVSANSAVLTDKGPAGTGGTRAQYLYDALTATRQTFSSSSGIGGVSAPYAATVAGFAQDVVSAQGAQAANAQSLDEGQTVALNTAQARFSKSAGVDVDEEMSNLIALQTAYSANARVLTAARDMLDTLLRI